MTILKNSRTYYYVKNLLFCILPIKPTDKLTYTGLPRQYYIAPFLLALIIVIAAGLLGASSCGAKKIDLVGKWERYDDAAAGSVIIVEKLDKVRHGRLLAVKGALEEHGFTNNEIKWISVTQQDPTHYKGQELVKLLDEHGVVKEIFYDSIEFTLVSQDILKITVLAENEDSNPSIQRWKRLE